MQQSDEDDSVSAYKDLIEQFKDDLKHIKGASAINQGEQKTADILNSLQKRIADIDNLD
ncbi:MAG: hypothetical protein KDD62_01180 [Bdellovibrionales bacterium]|nr:hypothetical protein [Bdellovibrionales bacterium]